MACPDDCADAAVILGDQVTLIGQLRRSQVAEYLLNIVMEFLEADMVIDAFGMRPNSELAEAIYQKYAPITSIIGDCNKVGQIAEAVRGGYFAAYSIH